MSVVINTNISAEIAANNLAYSSSRLQTSLNRLSSGSKIVNPADDAGGLAVSMKLTAAANREGDIQNNLSDATSFAQTQDGALSVVGSIMDRVSQLATLYSDPTKNTSDQANYNDEFTQLQAEITALSSETFNGIPLFGAQTMAVNLDDTGTSSVNVGGAALLSNQAVSDNFAANFTDASDPGASTSLTSGSAVLTSPDGSTFGVVQTDVNLTGPLTIAASFNISAGGSGEFGVQLGSDISASWGEFGLSEGSHTLNMTVDQSGNFTQSMDGGTVSTGNLGPGYTPPSTVDFYFASGSGSSASATITHASIDTGQSDVATVASATSLGSLDIATIAGAIQDVGTLRATNGAEQSRLNFASMVATTNQTNLQSAVSNISDVDVATETTQLAKWNVLVQAGTSMLTQANQSAQTALKLING